MTEFQIADLCFDWTMIHCWDSLASKIWKQAITIMIPKAKKDHNYGRWELQVNLFKHGYVQNIQ